MNPDNVSEQFAGYKPERRGAYTVFEGRYPAGHPATPQSNVDIGEGAWGEARAARTRESMLRSGQREPVWVVHGKFEDHEGNPASYLDDGNHRAAIAAEQNMDLHAKVMSYTHTPPPGLEPKHSAEDIGKLDAILREEGYR